MNLVYLDLEENQKLWIVLGDEGEPWARGEKESTAGPSTSTAGDIFEDEMTTMAYTLMAIRSTRLRKTSVVIHNVEDEPRRATPLSKIQSQDKGNGKMVEPEPTLKNPIKAQIQRDAEIAQRSKQIRNKPPTRAQLRNKMVTYLKHMGKYTHNQLKSKSFEEIQMLYEKEQKWINDFVPMDSEVVNDSKQQAESSKKRSRADHDKESVKIHKLEEDDAEKEELRACLDIVPVDDISINVESLAIKYPIVDWKTHTLTENMMYYQIIRANRSFKNYKILTETCNGYNKKGQNPSKTGQNRAQNGKRRNCMQTRSSSRLISNSSSNPTLSTNPNPKGRNRRHSKQRIEEFNLEELSPPIVMMADQRAMAQLLQAPTEGYEDANFVSAITADNFELKHGLLTFVQNKQFFGHDKEGPHAHIRYFNKITSTLKFPNVPNTSIKLMLFPFSLEGAARIWLEKEPPRSFFTWDDLASKFINQFFPPSKTTNVHNEITNFQQRFDESFSEAWDRFKDLFRAFPHHGFSELHHLDTFYNALNSKDQDSLNSAIGGNFLDKMPREYLAIIESKSKVRYSRNKPVVAKVSMNTSTSGISPDVAKLKDMVKALLIDKKSQNQAPATVKAVKESCVTCDGAHSY
nr:reverse transcriptase domain-containing protein [Tanacetum cinerariifolium]